jgi:hypothetical protein
LNTVVLFITQSTLKGIVMSLEYTIITDINNPLCGFTYDQVLQRVKQNGHALQHVEQQTSEICLAAVKESGLALRYVKHQTPDICLEAVKQNGNALQYVEQQTPEICLEAVQGGGDALYYVKDQTPELCLEAIKQSGHTLRYVTEQTLELCLEAVKDYGHALQYVKDEYLDDVQSTLKVKPIAKHDRYALIYQNGKYKAGCRGPWTRQEALNHWDEHHPNQERVTLFRNAIRNNVE